MSFPSSSNDWAYDDGSFNFLPWTYNSNSDQSTLQFLPQQQQQQQPQQPQQQQQEQQQRQQQPFTPPIPAYQPSSPPQHQHQSSESSSAFPLLPFPGSSTLRNSSLPGFNYPPHHSTPSDSLHAALREGADFLARPSLPHLSRYNFTPSQHSSFGYIPNHFFYSPPQSPDPPQHPANPHTNPPYTPIPSTSTQPLAGSSTTHPFTPSSAANHSASLFDSETLTGAFRGAQPQSQLPNTIDPSPVKQEDRDTMPPLPSSTTQASRKRSRPSCSGPPQSATKRRLNTPSIALDDSDDDQVEELGPDSSILAKEREALVNKQREESSKVNKIGDLNCMICLEHFTNMSATHCGHIFCHECLTQALVASQRNSDHNFGTCPACRKPIKPKSKNQIIPLTLMKGRKKA